ncbi:MAG: signal peptidase II [Bdellovibrionota bacterium]|nr:signal peptidase II [Bdellovibrionota bacterium]
MKWKYILTLAISGAVVAIDQLTKLMIYTQYHLGQSTPVVQDIFHITYVRNYGAAFGFLAKAPEVFRDNFFLAIPPIAIILILYILRDVSDDDNLQITCYAGILGGALGNYIDRLHLGYVVDFLDFHYKDAWSYPAFNVADMAIVGGVGCLLILTLFEGKKKDPNPDPEPGDSDKVRKISA